MATRTSIQWADHTFNPWIGCAKVSEGCRNCYAERSTPARVRGIRWGGDRLRTSAANWRQPVAWNRKAAGLAARPRVFCASLADWLDPDVPIQWLSDLLFLIERTPHLDWLLLTKRPGLFWERLREVREYRDSTGQPRGWVNVWLRYLGVPGNVWFGVSVENEASAAARISIFMQIPAWVRFLSVEPLLGPIPDLFSATGHSERERIDWVIVGGESGHQARRCSIDWIEEIIDQCHVRNVPVFVKQLGAFPAVRDIPSKNGGVSAVLGLDLTDPKGGDPDEWPVKLRVRQLPVFAALASDGQTIPRRIEEVLDGPAMAAAEGGHQVDEAGQTPWEQEVDRLAAIASAVYYTGSSEKRDDFEDLPEEVRDGWRCVVTQIANEVTFRVCSPGRLSGDSNGSAEGLLSSVISKPGAALKVTKTPAPADIQRKISESIESVRAEKRAAGREVAGGDDPGDQVESMLTRLMVCRQDLRDLYGDDYDARMVPFRNAVRNRMRVHRNDNPIAVALSFRRYITGEPAFDKGSMVRFMAAAADVIDEDASDPSGE